MNHDYVTTTTFSPKLFTEAYAVVRFSCNTKYILQAVAILALVSNGDFPHSDETVKLGSADQIWIENMLVHCVFLT